MTFLLFFFPSLGRSKRIDECSGSTRTLTRALPRLFLLDGSPYLSDWRDFEHRNGPLRSFRHWSGLSSSKLSDATLLAHPLPRHLPDFTSLSLRLDRLLNLRERPLHDFYPPSSTWYLQSPSLRLRRLPFKFDHSFLRRSQK